MPRPAQRYRGSLSSAPLTLFGGAMAIDRQLFRIAASAFVTAEGYPEKSRQLTQGCRVVCVSYTSLSS
jgi:hypothetical protein